MDISLPWFGRRPPEKTLAAWGARAIFDGKTIDLLPDRQSWSESDADARARLCEWIDQKGLPWVRDQIHARRLSTTDPEVLAYDEAGFHIEASPQRSGGYLYLGAWEAAVTVTQGE